MKGFLLDFPTDKNFVYYEDNEDNTITVTLRWGEVFGTVLFPVDFSEFMSSMLSGADLNVLTQNMFETAVHIPNDINNPEIEKDD